MTTAQAVIQGHSALQDAVPEAHQIQAEPAKQPDGSYRLKNKLAAYMKGKGITNIKALARHLDIGAAKVGSWLNGSKFPNAKYARRLIELDIVTKEELDSMRPPRKPRVRTPAAFVRGIRMFTLAEYAARV